MEVERCCERMAEVEKDDECVTSHPGFGKCLLSRWVLATAAIGLKTKQMKAYTTLFAEGNTTEEKLVFYILFMFQLPFDFCFLWCKMTSFAVSTCIYIKLFCIRPPKLLSTGHMEPTF